MSGEIKRIDFIKNMAVFQEFQWEKSVLDENNKVAEFKKINILYGQNYSGKTTLSRIFRAMERGVLSENYVSPKFQLTFEDNTDLNQNSLIDHDQVIRVFNEDFVRENLRFITNPDDSIEPFAIFGSNIKIEKEIESLESKLGSKEEGKETGLYFKKVEVISEFERRNQAYQQAKDKLDQQLKDKATDREIGIKYKSERFGDQNYNIQKLKHDIDEVLDPKYQSPTNEQLAICENLITEKILQPILSFRAPILNFMSLTNETAALVTKKISESDKIEDLVKDAVLNRWVNDGRAYHKGRRDDCAFCGNFITNDRWTKLEKHFDEESEELEEQIDALIIKIDEKKDTVSSALSINKSIFYSYFHERLDTLDSSLKDAVNKYNESLEALIAQLKARKSDILNQKEFKNPNDVSADLESIWNSYEVIREESDHFLNSIGTEQNKAKKTLRLKHISDYLITIRYQDQYTSISDLKDKSDQAKQRKERIERDIRQKEDSIMLKKRELNDEEKGAKKVNEYLNNFFGHQFLSLEAKKNEIIGEESKQVRFEVIRDGKKAYHLSEGECSLLAFCYFLAKLEDIDTKDLKPIIWIDDPISSLDGNHIFFVYSLINAEIIAGGKFEQLFVSTHNLDFLRYLRRLKGKNDRNQDYQKNYFVVVRQGKTSTVEIMPRYLKEYATEFNYLFHQIYKCASIELIDDKNYVTFYNFGNNARKFFEIYLYYKYPDQRSMEEKLHLFFGDEKIPAILTSRVSNEYSHLQGIERGAIPMVVPEMRTAAQQIIEKLKEDNEQYLALLKSIGANEESSEGM